MAPQLNQILNIACILMPFRIRQYFSVCKLTFSYVYMYTGTYVTRRTYIDHMPDCPVRALPFPYVNAWA